MSIFNKKEPLIVSLTTSVPYIIKGWMNLMILPATGVSFVLTFADGSTLNYNASIGFGFGVDGKSSTTIWAPMTIVSTGSVQLIINGDVAI